MARKTGQGGRGRKRGGTGAGPHSGMRPEDFEDEVDGFHKERDKINLDVDDDLGDSEEEGEDEAVFNVQGADDSSEEEDEDDDLDEERLTGMAAKFAKQAKYMRQKLGGAKEEGEEDDEEEEEDGEERDGSVWGKRKKEYYSADNVDFELQSDDEETPLEEEKEVMRLQKKLAAGLRPEDYEQEDEDEEEEDEEDEDEMTMQEALQEKETANAGEPGGKKEKKGGKQSNARSALDEGEEGGVAVEAVQKDLAALSKEEQMAAVMSDAPELVGLLADLKQSLDELRNKVQPLLEQVRAGEYATADGLSYLEAKHLLLLSYCSTIVFYLLLRAEGRSVRDHPVIARLVELRLYLEKIRPIDKKLQYQIDKLLKAANAADSPAANGEVPGGMGKDEALKYRPNPDLLVSKLDADAQDGGGVYRPPMIAPAAMEDEDKPRGSRSQQRADRESRKRATRSAYVKELAAELEGRPEEIQESVGIESREMQRERERLQKRAEEEENLFARVPLSKEERKRLRALQNNRNALSGLLEDFDDDVADIVNNEDKKGGASAAADGGLPEDLLKRRKLSQVIAEAGRPAKKAKVVSGDADLPAREDLGERRRAHDAKSVSRKAKQIEFDDEDGSGGGEGDEMPEGGAEEDEVYREAQERRAAKLASKAERFGREAAVPREEEAAEGKRSITREMEKNRGLTPHRKKLVRNPRKKYKVAHAKAVVRRKGQVRDVQRETAPYAGQATGIKASVSRSTRLGR